MGKRFTVLMHKLSDDSEAYAVRFFLEDPTRYVDLECIDKAHAESLAEELEGAVSFVETN